MKIKNIWNHHQVFIGRFPYSTTFNTMGGRLGRVLDGRKKFNKLAHLRLISPRIEGQPPQKNVVYWLPFSRQHHEPPKPWKIKVLGYLKSRWFIIETSKNVGFAGTMAETTNTVDSLSFGFSYSWQVKSKKTKRVGAWHVIFQQNWQPQYVWSCIFVQQSTHLFAIIISQKTHSIHETGTSIFAY